MGINKQIQTWGEQIRQAQLEDAKTSIKKWIRESMRPKEDLLGDPWKQWQIFEVAQKIFNAVDRGNKVLACGNGGSAGDAGHFVGEFLNQLGKVRVNSLAAIDLSAMTSTITAIGNDYGYEHIFSKQIEGLGKPGDVLIAISTSGNSENVLHAIKRAKEIGITTVLLTGKYKKEYCYNKFYNPLSDKMEKTVVEPDYLITVNSDYTPMIQESHIMILHILVYLVDCLLGTDYLED